MWFLKRRNINREIFVTIKKFPVERQKQVRKITCEWFAAGIPSDEILFRLERDLANK